MEIKKIPGGFEVDGIKLLKGKCGCTSLAKCCYSWSKLKSKGTDFKLEAKMTTPDTTDNFYWGYTVAKEGINVSVRVEDARDKEIFTGYIPPALEEWEERGWQTIKQEGHREDGVVFRCAMCKWLYKDDIQAKPFAELPDDWKCPVCKAQKKQFEKIG